MEGVQNAKDVVKDDLGKPKILLVGSTGGGKTSQFLTLPGKTFVYAFDPSTLSTLRGHDIDYQIFMPTRINLATQSLSKGKGDPVRPSDAADVYLNWELDFEEKDKEYAMRLIEQACYIEEYRKEVLSIQGRQLSEEEAAKEWIDKYASAFPE